MNNHSIVLPSKSKSDLVSRFLLSAHLRCNLYSILGPDPLAHALTHSPTHPLSSIRFSSIRGHSPRIPQRIHRVQFVVVISFHRVASHPIPFQTDLNPYPNPTPRESSQTGWRGENTPCLHIGVVGALKSTNQPTFEDSLIEYCLIVSAHVPIHVVHGVKD